MKKAALKPSHILGRSEVSRLYYRKRASRHSYAPWSVPFTVDICTVSHAPIFVTCRKRRVTWTAPPPRVSASASYGRRTFRFRASYLPSLTIVTWYAVLISSWPLSAAKRFPVMTQDAVKFSRAVSIRSRRDSPAYFP